MSTTTEFAPLAHPGPLAPNRIESAMGTTVVERLSLTPGRRLIDAIDEALVALGLDSAQVELMGGPLARVSYCVPDLCHDGSRAAWYSPTHEAVVPVSIVGGSATVGRRDGERFMHCHAAWYDADGALRGGHLWPETIVGSTPVEVVLYAFDEIELTSGVDDETLMPVFTPSSVPSNGWPGRRAVMSRVRPGIEIHEALRQVMISAGFTRASVRGSLGSLVGGTLRRGSSIALVDGPATEVAIAGHAVRQGDRFTEVHLPALVMDRHGGVHVGQLTEHGNLVAVTFELIVEEIES